MEVLKTIIVCYAALLALSSIVACKLYFLYRTKPFLLLMLIWPLTLANFILQANFVESLAGSILSFSTYFFTALCLANLLYIITGIGFSWRRYSLVWGASLLLAMLSLLFEASFTLASLPIAIAIAAPQLHAALIKLIKYRQSGPELSNFFALVLLLNGIHFLDYPFLRPLPEMAVYGFGSVMIITILFSLLLPIITSKHHTNQLNARLIEETENAQRLAKVKGDFLANMSHEVRTPINGIRGINDLLLNSELTSEQRELCEVAQKSIERLTTLVSDILSYSQLESGEIKLRNEPVFIPDICQELENYYALISDADNIEIIFSVSESARQCILLDQGKVIQILHNLITNAVKYTTGEKVHITFDVVQLPVTQGGLSLQFTVYDNGIGIPRHEQEKIYAEFNQLEPGRGGVGLGLAIVKKLINALGGKIELLSQHQAGTSFTCSIPVILADPSTSEYKSTKSNSTKPQHKPSNTSAFQVLAVEDDPTSQMILEATFRKEHITGLVTGSAEEALSALNNSTFNLVISDINLPGMSGLELIKEVRASQPDLPIVVQSAFAFEHDENHALEAGANGYLRKPITYKDIVDVCRRYGAYTRSGVSAND